METAFGTPTSEPQIGIMQFYKGSTVLLTGASGFIGSLHMEKLLRSCDVRKMFIIVRTKKGQEPRERIKKLFGNPSFDPLKKQYPNFIEKVSMLSGDMELPNLGLDDRDIEVLKEEVDVVFHYAATVKFDEKLRTATYINVRAVKDLLRIAKSMKKLKAYVHISTAYSNCLHKTVGEIFYEPPLHPEKLLSLVECLDEKKLDDCTELLIGDFPNTYTFTKCIAEHLVKTEVNNLPIALFRPSIVVATKKEPIPGWIYNLLGPSGIVLGGCVGILKVIRGNENRYADLVPADYVVNCALATAWDIGKRNNCKEITKRECKKDPIYNYVSTPERPITWGQFRDFITKYGPKVASVKCIWYGFLIFCDTPWIYLLINFLLHTIPAHLVDFMARCLRKEPMLVKIYGKINKFSTLLSYFTLRDWNFQNNNVQLLWKKLDGLDKKTFEFNMKELNWNEYLETYIKGTRVYLMGDPLDTLPQGKIKYKKLRFAHYAVVTIVSAIFFKSLWIIFNYLFS